MWKIGEIVTQTTNITIVGLDGSKTFHVLNMRGEYSNDDDGKKTFIVASTTKESSFVPTPELDDVLTSFLVINGYIYVATLAERSSEDMALAGNDTSSNKLTIRVVDVTNTASPRYAATTVFDVFGTKLKGSQRFSRTSFSVSTNKEFLIIDCSDPGHLSALLAMRLLDEGEGVMTFVTERLSNGVNIVGGHSE